jgi:hypothetical protein
MQPTLPLGEVKSTSSVIASGSVVSAEAVPFDDVSVEVVAADDDVLDAGP